MSTCIDVNNVPFENLVQLMKKVKIGNKQDAHTEILHEFTLNLQEGNTHLYPLMITWSFSLVYGIQPPTQER